MVKVCTGPFKVVVYHNLGTWESEWSLGDDDIRFEIGEATVVIGVHVVYPDGTLAGAMFHNAQIVEATETINVSMDQMRRAIEQVESHDLWIREELDVRAAREKAADEEPAGEGRQLGSGDPDGTGDRSEGDSGELPDGDLPSP